MALLFPAKKQSKKPSPDICLCITVPNYKMTDKQGHCPNNEIVKVIESRSCYSAYSNNHRL